VQRPVSITVFAVFFGASVLLSLLLALDAARTTDFGFALAPQAAHTLALRICAIRLLGVVFALSLMLLVVFGKSRAARGALGLRWALGLVTSVAFLRGIGVVVPIGGGGMAAIALSILQLGAEGFAILLLYGEDAAAWFERRFGY
jgi:NAD/NADP transhydrogenase beta subunit